ncbi:hypothetical protein G5V59_06305 [Nocardioides sp. W3-2-3]|nr:hypothetical protein [Nocardioides convexus]
MSSWLRLSATGATIRTLMWNVEVAPSMITRNPSGPSRKTSRLFGDQGSGGSYSKAARRAASRAFERSAWRVRPICTMVAGLAWPWLEYSTRTRHGPALPSGSSPGTAAGAAPAGSYGW